MRERENVREREIEREREREKNIHPCDYFKGKKSPNLKSPNSLNYESQCDIVCGRTERVSRVSRVSREVAK